MKTNGVEKRELLLRLRQELGEMDEKETALLRRLAIVRGAEPSRRISEELMELRFQRVVKQAIIDELGGCK